MLVCMCVCTCKFTQVCVLFFVGSGIVALQSICNKIEYYLHIYCKCFSHKWKLSMKVKINVNQLKHMCNDHVGLAQACPNYKHSYVQIWQAISPEPSKIGTKILETFLWWWVVSMIICVFVEQETSAVVWNGWQVQNNIWCKSRTLDLQRSLHAAMISRDESPPFLTT